MISLNKKLSLKCTISILALMLIVGCTKNTPLKQADNGQNKTSNTNTTKQGSGTNKSTVPSSSTIVKSNSIVYKNNEYGFNFLLPNSWKGYSIITDKWKGIDIKSGTVTETGYKYSIRHPKWTTEKPRQDIPIMVFTTNQWELILQEKLAVGAAPIGPSELGRNSNYVFALPARYNFAYEEGYKEVEQILNSKPLKTIPDFDKGTALLLNMTQLAKVGRVINAAFPVKTTNIKTVEKAFGKPNQSNIVAAKGTYATFSKYNVAFGYNKTGQIFEARSLASPKFKYITASKVKKVLGTPTYNKQYKGQEIIGYKIGLEFKIEMVFPITTSTRPNMTMDHYNIIYTK